MIKLDEYINVGSKRMRCGYTTGTCAAAAARAAAELLFTGERIDTVRIATPAGIEIDIDIESYECGDGFVECSVQKDAGDDPDVTDGVYVFARVQRSEEPGIRIDGGLGVGRVTQAGLDQPVGEAAINSVPREMIAEQVQELLDDGDGDCGALVTVSIPAGVELAKKTFNPRLGIEGGVSVLGTSGIVRPMSEEALVSSIELECSVLRARGVRHLLVCPGNYGKDFAHNVLGLDLGACVQCSNYIGAAIDTSVSLDYETVLVVGHIGKMAKVASGAMNTHSRVSDARLETLAAHAAICSGSEQLIRGIMACVTTDAALDLLEKDGILEQTMASMTKQLEKHLRNRVGDSLQIEAIVFSNKRGMLACTSGAEELMDLHALREGQGEDS